MEKKYQSVISYIKNEIVSGNLKPGQKLPSIREMTGIFGCNKITIIRAYSELEKEHLLYSKPKSGYYIVESRDISTAAASNNSIIDFSSAAPDAEVLPYREFQHSINKAIDIYKDNLFSYSEPQGLAALRKTLSKYLSNFQVFANANDIFITTGSQQALFILAAMPFPNGKNNVLVEQPTFIGMLNSLYANNITTLGIERTSEGLNLEELERLFKNGNIKFFYTIPRFHNPTGFSYSNEQKKAILALAKKYDVYVVEDDYLLELETDTKTDPIFAFDSTAHVIYIKSFSKTLLPGLRIASVVLPKLLLNSFAYYKKCSDINTSVLSQGALEIYLNSGMFEKHVNKVRKIYQSRMNALRKSSICLEQTGMQCYIPDSGFFACYVLPKNIKAQSLITELASKNVYALSTEAMFLTNFSISNRLRLSICRVDEDRIAKGINIMHDVIKNMSQVTAVRRSYIDL